MAQSEKYRKLAKQWEEEYIRQQEEKAGAEKKRTQEQIVAQDRRRKQEMRAAVSQRYKQQAEQKRQQTQGPAAGNGGGAAAKPIGLSVAGNNGGRQTIAQAFAAQGVTGLPMVQPGKWGTASITTIPKETGGLPALLDKAAQAPYEVTEKLADTMDSAAQFLADPEKRRNLTSREFWGNNFMAGLSNFNKGAANLVDMVLPDWLTDEAAPFLRKGLDWYERDGAGYEQKAADVNQRLGMETLGSLTQSAAQNLPNLAFGMMGAPAGAAAQLGAPATGLANALRTSAGEMAAKPAFWTSLLPTAGNSYARAKEEGANELQAQAMALLNGVVNAGIEVGGGIETLNTAPAGWRGIAQTALEEGTEEVKQGLAENLLAKGIYRQDAPWVGMGTENAVVDPLRMAQEFGAGALMGGVMGAGGRAVNKGLDLAGKAANRALGLPIAQQKQANVQTEAQADVEGLDAKQQRAAQVAKKMGVPLEFADSLEYGASGKYENGTITISRESQDPVLDVMKHELTHHIEQSGRYESFAQAVVERLQTQGIDTAAVEQGIMREYAAAGKRINPAEARQELVAKFTQSKLFTDDVAIDDLARTDKGLARQVLDFLNDAVQYVKGTGDERFLQQAQRKYQAALRDTQKNGAAQAGDAQYAIVQGEKGPYVQADRPVLTGNDPAQWEGQLYDYLNQNIRHGQDLTVQGADGDPLTITEKTAWKMGYRNEIRDRKGQTTRMSNEQYAAKLRAAGHIDEITQVSKRGSYTVPDYKNHDFARDGFNYRKAYYQDADGQMYELTVSVGQNGEVNTVYNIGKMQKKETSRLLGAHPLQGANVPNRKTTGTSAEVSSINSISNGMGNVNNIGKMQKEALQNLGAQTAQVPEGTSARTSSTDSISQSGPKVNGQQALGSDFDTLLERYGHAAAEQTTGLPMMQDAPQAQPQGLPTVEQVQRGPRNIDDAPYTDSDRQRLERARQLMKPREGVAQNDFAPPAQRTGQRPMATRDAMENAGKNVRTESGNAVRDLITSHPVVGGVNNTQGADAILKAEQNARQYARDFTDLAKSIEATTNEVRNAKLLADGDISLDDIGRNDRASVVQRLAELQQQANQAKAGGVQGMKRQIFEMQQAKYKAMLENINNPEGLVVKSVGKLRLNSRTPERVFKKVFGAELGGKLAEDVITPIHYNESAKIQNLNTLFDQARGLDLNETERRLVQLVGEGVAGKNGRPVTVEDIRKGNVGVDSLPGHMDPKEAKAVLEHMGDVDASKVERGVEFYRKTYDEFHGVINEFRVSRGLEPIGKKENYFPHFSQDDPLTKTMKRLGIEGVGNLPTSIAGQTAYNRPNSRWVAAFQRRTGPKTSYDCDMGFQTYANSVMDMLYHTDDIMKLRSLDAAVRGRYTETDFKDTIDSILTKKNMKLNADETALMEKVLNGEYMDMEAGKQYANFASWLTQYTNKLANKQLLMDRAVEDAFGRMALNLPNEISGAFGRNSVVGNISSALNNTVTLPKILATSSQRDVAAAVKGLVTGEFKRLDIAEQSEFLQGKKGVNYLVQSKTQKTSKWVSDHLFEPVEEAVTDVAFYTKYLEKMRNAPAQGTGDYAAHQQQAIAAADEYAASMMARRSKGSRPLLMESKNPLYKLATMFQTEVSNDFYSLVDDLPEYYKAQAKTEEGKRQVVDKIAAGATKYVVYSFALNTLLEGLTGYAPAPDPVRWLWEFAKDLFDEDEETNTVQKAAGAVGGLLNNVGDQVPYLSTALAMAGMGNGRVPLPNYDMDKIGGGVSALMESDEKAPNKYAYAAQQLWNGAVVPTGMLLLPFGGNQMKKTVEGVNTMARGGMYKQTKQGEQLQTPVNNDPGTLQGAANWAKAALFGRSAIDEVGDYYDQNGRPMTEKKTEVYKALEKRGAKKEALVLLPTLKTNMSAAKLAQTLQNTGLEEKQAAIVWETFGSENARSAYAKAAQKGLGRVYTDLLLGADTNGNGKLTKEEIQSYLDAARLELDAKRLLFSLASTAKNPY